jgi:MFS superfamily sulfate permease-like transporter
MDGGEFNHESASLLASTENSNTRTRASHHSTRSPSATSVVNHGTSNLHSAPREKLTWPQIQTEMLSGTVVSLALIPESVAFSIVAGVSPIKSLVTTSVMLLASASVGGRPGMISGAGGALAVVSSQLVREKGEAYLFLAVGLCGLMQVALSALNVDDMLRMLPTSVISGFMCGLAFIIFKSQTHYFGGLNGLHDGWEWMLALSILGLGVLRVSERFPSSVPASLVAIVSLTVLVEVIRLPTLVSCFPDMQLASMYLSIFVRLWLDLNIGVYL